MTTRTDISLQRLFPIGFPEAVLSVKDLACVRGGRVVFQNISFDVKSGEALHLSGHNGAGKSSLLRVIAGAIEPAAGAIFWNETPCDDDSREEHLTRLSFLPPDDRHVKILETVAENLHFWARIAGQAGDDYIYMAAHAMDLSALLPRQARVLSAGQKRRLSLSQMLLRQAPLWLLDEPLNGLDHHAAALFHAVLSDHLKAGGIALIASHQPVEGARLYEVGR